MYNKTIIEFGFRMISWIIKTSCLYYLPQPSGSADKTDLGFDNSWYHAQPHPIIVYYINVNERNKVLQTEMLFSDIFLSLWWPGCTLTDLFYFGSNVNLTILLLRLWKQFFPFPNTEILLILEDELHVEFSTTSS